MVLARNLVVILCNVTKKMVKKKKFKLIAIGLMTSRIMPFIEKLCKKWLNYAFFLRLTLSQIEKRFSRSFFSF